MVKDNIYSLNDVTNALGLDIYKRCLLEEIDKIRDKIQQSVLIQIEKICHRIIVEPGVVPIMSQPENVKIFFPPNHNLLEFLDIDYDTEQNERERQDAKRKNEKLLKFSCGLDNRLYALYENENEDFVLYTYDYDLEDEHNVFLKSRVEYKGGRIK